MQILSGLELGRIGQGVGFLTGHWVTGLRHSAIVEISLLLVLEFLT